jgi:hypothetical protein
VHCWIKGFYMLYICFRSICYFTKHTNNNVGIQWCQRLKINVLLCLEFPTKNCTLDLSRSRHVCNWPPRSPKLKSVSVYPVEWISSSKMLSAFQCRMYWQQWCANGVFRTLFYFVLMLVPRSWCLRRNISVISATQENDRHNMRRLASWRSISWPMLTITSMWYTVAICEIFCLQTSMTVFVTKSSLIFKYTDHKHWKYGHQSHWVRLFC